MHEIGSLIGSGYGGADGREARMDPLEASLKVARQLGPGTFTAGRRDLHLPPQCWHPLPSSMVHEADSLREVRCRAWDGRCPRGSTVPAGVRGGRGAHPRARPREVVNSGRQSGVD